MTDQAIVATNLTKVYRSRWSGREVRAVDGLSLSVRRGSIFGLLGPNGAGKTTFVKMLLSAVHPTEGSATILGRNASEPEARRPIGYLPENHRFPTYFTGEGMLDFYAALSGMDSAARRRRIPELLDLVGLKDWGHVRIGKYSKGMLQRVGLAQAIIHEPEILILDEPTDGVDPVGRRHIRDILHRLEEKGATIFINSHLLSEVETFCEEVAILRKGKVVVTGKIRDLTAGKGYRLSAAAVPDQLRDELRLDAVSVIQNNGFVDFQFASREQVNQALDKLRREQCEIEALVPTTSTLEEVFVTAVEGDGVQSGGTIAASAGHGASR
jgi:ABC-2 type transport system ATP-binding protein